MHLFMYENPPFSLLSWRECSSSSEQLRSWNAAATGLRMIAEGDPCSGWIRGRRIGSLRTLAPRKEKAAPSVHGLSH